MRKAMTDIFKLLIFGLIIGSCRSTSRTTAENYFEGNIKFKTEYVIKTDKVTGDFLDKTIGKTADLYFKDGNYREFYDGGFILEQLHRRADNKNYVRKTRSDTLFWYNCAAPGQKLIKFEINPNKEIVLGIPCDEYVTYYDNKTVSFYFNSDTLKIDPDWFLKYTLANENIDKARMKSMCLKYKIEFADFVITMTATSIINKKVDNSMFDIKPTDILVQGQLYE